MSKRCWTARWAIASDRQGNWNLSEADSVNSGLSQDAYKLVLLPPEEAAPSSGRFAQTTPCLLPSLTFLLLACADPTEPGLEASSCQLPEISPAVLKPKGYA